MKDTEIQQIVARVTREISKEVEASDGNFRVADLPGHLRELADTLNEAWSITYDTSSSALAGGMRPASAWSITYDTSSSAAIRTQKAK